MINNKKDPVWAFSEHDRNEIKISLLTLVLGPISRFPVAALAKTKWRLKHAPKTYVHSVATFVHWNENSKLSKHLQFTCCSVSPVTGKPGWSVHFDSRSVHKEKKISTMSPAWTFIRSPAKDIHGYCNCLRWQRDII